jgi:hypothetical protein
MTQKNLKKMSYTKKIEVYKILNDEFVTPLACAPETKKAQYYKGDFLYIIDNQVWVTNNNLLEEDEYSLAIYSPAFVRMNPSIFEKQ